MATIAENLQAIIDIKDDIKTAIENKGVVVGDATFSEYASKIGEIISGVSKIDVGAYGLRFAYSTFIEVPDIFSFNNITDMRWMFGGNTNLTSVPFFDTSLVEDFSNSFRNTNLTTIPPYNTSNAKNMTYIFYYSNIVTIPELDCSKCDTISNGFNSCDYLTNVGGFTNFGERQSVEQYQTDISLWFPDSNLLTYESCTNIINKVYDMTSFDYRKTATIKFHSTPYSLLSPEDIAIATNKGWTVESA